MKKKVILLCTMSSLLLGSGATGATPHALSVQGELKPLACEAVIGGNGVIDYGRIPVSRIPRRGNLFLDRRQIPFSIRCDARTLFSVAMQDNQPHTVPPGTSYWGSQSSGRELFGLGIVREKRVGAFVLMFRDGAFRNEEGVALQPIHGRDGVQGWSDSWHINGSFNGSTAPGSQVAWARAVANNSFNPASVRQVIGVIEIGGFLNTLDALDLSADVPLQGSVTIELRAL